MISATKFNEHTTSNWKVLPFYFPPDSEEHQLTTKAREVIWDMTLFSRIMHLKRWDPPNRKDVQVPI